MRDLLPPWTTLFKPLPAAGERRRVAGALRWAAWGTTIAGLLVAIIVGLFFDAPTAWLVAAGVFALWSFLLVRPVSRAYARALEGTMPPPGARVGGGAAAVAVGLLAPILLAWSLTEGLEGGALYVALAAAVGTFTAPLLLPSGWRLLRGANAS